MNHELNSTPDDADQIWEDARWLKKNEDEDGSSKYRAYTPQLMDTQEMQALRTALNRTEMQIQEQGHMQEYVPRKPSSPKLRRWYGLPRNHRAMNRPTMSTGPSSRLGSPRVHVKNRLIEHRASSARPPLAGVKMEKFERILKEETRQVRELESRYADTKRSLLEYVDIVTTCKPNDRVGGQDVYEQLADLMSFAAKCTTSE